MSMSVSMQKSSKRTNLKHNNRMMSEKEKEKNPHIDSSKSHENKYLVQRDLKELYQDEFGAALEKYNAKQKRNDRKIDNYFEHIKVSKKTALQQEMIIQVGDKDDFASEPIYKKYANDILEEWVQGFEERNPNLFHGLSKSHAMTGYRIGFLMGHQRLIEQAVKVSAFNIYVHQYRVNTVQLQH